MEEIKSLSALLFSNLTEILNGNERKEEIINNIQNRLQVGIQGLLEEIIHNIKEDSCKEIDLTGYCKLLKHIDPKGNLFRNIENIEKLKRIVESRDYLLPPINKKELISLKKKFVENDSTGGASRAKILDGFKNYKKIQRVFKRKTIGILVDYVLIPTMIENNKYQQVMMFLSNTDNFFNKTNRNVQYSYKDTKNIATSIERLLSDYYEISEDVSNSTKLTDIPSFQAFLKALFFQLEDNSIIDKKEVSIQNDEYNIRNEIDNFISEKIGSVIGIESSGVMETEQYNMRMCIAQRIEEDYLFFNNKFSFSWVECNAHQGFRALAYYRIYKILCNYEDNESLNCLGEELIEQCWQETSIYISPNSDVVAPVYIGKDCLITSACKIEKNVIIGSGTKLVSSRLKEPLTDEKEYVSLIVIGRNSIVMQNVFIYDRARLGEYCVITPNSVVKSSVEKNSIFNSTTKQLNLKKQDYFMKIREEEIKCVRM